MDGLYILVGFFLFVGAALFVTYLLQCFALWRMAKNAGLPWALLAWIPWAQSWLLGWFCDRACAFRSGRNWRFRVIFPILSLVTPGFLNIFLAERLSLPSLSDLLYRYGLYQLPSLLQMAATVVTAFGLYYLYADYAPGRETPYAILSVVVSFAAPGILLFLLREKIPLSAGGTPPRTPTWGPGTTGPASPFQYQTPPSPPPAPPAPEETAGPIMPPFRWKDPNKK